MDEMKTIEIKDLCGGYEDKQIFENVKTELRKGSFTALAGPNGSGKTTLLKYLIKELKTLDDKVVIIGQDINSLKQKQLARKLSFVGQSTAVSYEFSVSQLVSMGLYSKEQKKSSEVQKALDITGISHLKDKLVTRISGGELQMAMLARAVCQDTDCIVLDEPVNNLDPKHQIKLLSLLKNLSRQGKTVLCVLHDLNAILTWCDSCILLKDGRIFAQGDTSAVITKENVKAVYDVDCIFSQVDGHTQLTYRCSL